MPWEAIQPKPDEPTPRGLKLVTPDFVPEAPGNSEPDGKPTRAKRVPLHIGARMGAHGFDLTLVGGLSFYSAKALTLGFMAAYATYFTPGGGQKAFADHFDYVTAQLLPGCAAYFSVLYFVAAPAVWARTPGMGLFGLKVVHKDGGEADVGAHVRRLLGCLLVYASGGTLLLSSLRGRPSRLPQDSFSGTHVVRAK